ncbi:MAG: ATP-dependent DNA helicase, partial [Myxococcota bacterium]
SQADFQPILISTRTKLLQDQLLRKDVAATARFLGHNDLRAISIKGRANYICARRLGAVLEEGREPRIFAEDRLAYAALWACAGTRPYGEVGALPAALLRRYPALRDLIRRSVAARAEQCSRDDCARQHDCPFGQRRAALARAHLVVANHDLLLRWPPDYPSFVHAIVDEGHELSTVADEVYALMVRPDELLERIDDLFGRSSKGGSGDALLPRSRRRGAERDVRGWRRSLHRDLSAIGHALAGHANEYGDVELPTHAGRLFPEVAERAAAVAEQLERVAEEAEERDPHSERGDVVASPVQKNAAELRNAAEAMRLAFGSSSEEVVASFEGLTSPYDRWTLALRQVSPAEAFHRGFARDLESLAVVSASLFVAGDPFAALGELEIEERCAGSVERVCVASPFPYVEHMRVVALDESGELVEQTSQVILELARHLRGRTLGLFTSLRRMNQVAELLAPALRAEGLDLLAPRRAADDPAALVERFTRSGGAGVLLGAKTFWQGLDLPGRDLQAVVIEKLPFEVPTELRKRRQRRIEQTLGGAFGRYTLGKMLLYLKQMMGRLIRSEEDRGIVVIVEGRTRRGYFPRLSEAMPPGVEVQVAAAGDLTALADDLGLGRSSGAAALTNDDS